MAQFEHITQSKSDVELTTIFIKNRGYQEAFLIEVEEELKRRNIDLKPLIKLRDVQMHADEAILEQGQQGSQFWMIFAFISSIAGGVWAIFAGYSYAYSKHRVNGIEYFVYNESTRKYGKYIFRIGTTVFILFLLGKVLEIHT